MMHYSINEVIRMPASMGGLFFLYNHSGKIIHIWHSGDIRDVFLGIWRRFSSPLRGTAYFAFVPYTDERTRLALVNYYIENLHPTTQTP
jgi:hypothetical protein